MKKLLLLITVLTIGAASQAQVQRNSKQSPTSDSRAPKNKKTIKDLGLTKVQKGHIKEIRQEFKTQKEAISTNKSLSEADKKAQLVQLSQEQRARISAILTEEQKLKFSASNKGKGKQPLPRRGVTNMPNERTSN